MQLPDLMKGVLLLGHGGPEQLVYRDDIKRPRPGPGDVLIRVEAAGINNTDLNTRKAWYSKGDGDALDATWSGTALTFPRIQGADVCGTIVETGQGISDARIGERVLVEPCLREAHGQRLATPWYLGSECDGGFAQFTVVAACHAHAVRSNLASVALASFPCAYSTAENMLTRTRVTADDRVLVTGASGGVGSAAVQLAKARGAHVTALTRQNKSHRLLSIGADETIDREDVLANVLGTDAIDVVLDLVAGPRWPDLLEVLKPGGRYAVAGAIAGAEVELDVRTLYLKDLSVFGCTVLDDGVFGQLINMIERDQLQPLVAQTFPLAQIGSAQAVFEAKAHVGKIVLEVPH